jgi:hypothetical protein
MSALPNRFMGNRRALDKAGAGTQCAKILDNARAWPQVEQFSVG